MWQGQEATVVEDYIEPTSPNAPRIVEIRAGDEAFGVGRSDVSPPDVEAPHEAGVACTDCNQLPEIVSKCVDNETSYRLECGCGGKGRPFRRSQAMAVHLWETSESRPPKPSPEVLAVHGWALTGECREPLVGEVFASPMSSGEFMPGAWSPMRHPKFGLNRWILTPIDSGAPPPVAGSELVARALALEYYRGQQRERYSNSEMLRTYAGPAADSPETAQAWIEEQAQHQASQFWQHWNAEAINLLGSVAEDAEVILGSNAVFARDLRRRKDHLSWLISDSVTSNGGNIPDELLPHMEARKAIDTLLGYFGSAATPTTPP